MDRGGLVVLQPLYSVGRVAGCPGPSPFWPPIYYTQRVSIKLLCNFRVRLCNFRVSVKVNHFNLVYIVYYNVQLLALIIYKCINYITLKTYRYAHFHQVARQLRDSRTAMFLCQVQD